ncbi:MAG: family 78 glycoside hydrolase catalytic domain, partial [Gammaproteobacteria bacterium]|nr:family 78 glycoside hydrolase catalytic domain [Gammaproteobacteria bacterium]
MNEPIRVTGTFKPLEITNPKPGMYIYDMGQNMVGWVKLTVKGKNGDEVKMRFSETLEDDGTLYLTNIRGANVTDRYILKGDGVETFEPRFVFHGFRYVEVTGYPGKPTIESIECKTVNDDVKTVGSFTCSNELINQIYKNSAWGIQGNYRSIPTDCPQRDERQGWLGDRALECIGESYMFDISKLYRKWLRDIFDTQKEKGSISDVSPAYWQTYTDDVTWAGASLFFIDMLYKQYGDTKVIEENYTRMKIWIDYIIDSYMKNDLVEHNKYGDWCVPPLNPKLIHAVEPGRLTPGELVGSSYFYGILKMMTNYAKHINSAGDEKYYSD